MLHFDSAQCRLVQHDKKHPLSFRMKQSEVKKPSYFSSMHKEGWHKYYVYILTNRHKTVLYTGVTNNLAKRLHQHFEDIREKRKSFVARYNCQHLLYYEEYTWVQEAIAREKEIKGWIRAKKLKLIRSVNPKLKFIENLFPLQDA